MADMEELFFENPLKVYFFLAFVEIILGAAWYMRRTPKLAMSLAIAPVLALAVGLVAHFVVTDREQIQQAMEEIGAGVSNGCLAPASKYIDANYSVPLSGGATLKREQLIALAQDAMDTYKISDVHLHDVQTLIEGKMATTKVNSRVTLGLGLIDVGWKLHWAKHNDGWRIVRVEITGPEYLVQMGKLA